MNLEQLLLDFLLASSQRALLPYRSLHSEDPEARVDLDRRPV